MVTEGVVAVDMTAVDMATVEVVIVDMVTLQVLHVGPQGSHNFLEVQAPGGPSSSDSPARVTSQRHCPLALTPFTDGSRGLRGC